jgi:hypothetical protein
VEYPEDSFCFTVLGKKFALPLDNCLAKRVIVIGNIYKNPELKPDFTTKENPFNILSSNPFIPLRCLRSPVIKAEHYDELANFQSLWDSPNKNK